jgi:hypothetical protein
MRKSLIALVFFLFFIFAPVALASSLKLSDPPYLSTKPISVSLSGTLEGQCYLFNIENTETKTGYSIGKNNCEGNGTKATGKTIKFDIPINTLPPGNYEMTSQISSDPSDRKTVKITIQADPASSFKLTVTPNPVVAGDPLTMTATGCPANSTVHFSWIKDVGGTDAQCDGKDTDKANEQNSTDCAEDVTSSSSKDASYTKSNFDTATDSTDGSKVDSTLYGLTAVCEATQQKANVNFTVTAKKDGQEQAPPNTPTPLPPSPPCAMRQSTYTDNQTIENSQCSAVDTALGMMSTNPSGFIQTIYTLLLSVSGGIALLLIIYSGYQLMTSRGNPEQVKAARERLTSAFVGLLFLIFSLVILEVLGFDILKIPGITS